jgi:hypothetical protein
MQMAGLPPAFRVQSARFQDVSGAGVFTTPVAEEQHEQQEEEEKAAAIFKQTAVAEYDYQQQEEEEQRIAFHVSKYAIKHTHG